MSGKPMEPDDFSKIFNAEVLRYTNSVLDNLKYETHPPVAHDAGSALKTEYRELHDAYRQMQAEISAYQSVLNNIEYVAQQAGVESQSGETIGYVIEFRGKLQQAQVEIEGLKHDIQVYRGYLGYAITAKDDGPLSDGTFPQNGIAEALQQQIENLKVKLKAAEYREDKANQYRDEVEGLLLPRLKHSGDCSWVYNDYSGPCNCGAIKTALVKGVK